MNEVDIREIMELLPHRYPFLLVDRVLDYTPGRCLTGVKNVSMNEPFFQGHFPHYPVMPGVLVLEALAQACGLLTFKTLNQPIGEDRAYFFVGIDKARFRRPVIPGDRLILEVEEIRTLKKMSVFKAVAKVDDEIAASAELMCTIVDV
ncbi:MAG: 3-hydroxyacyl-ACP dehydratase FabZ [Gammaproteobacteria bacterium]|nr:3-hydroxyacyl-ACP dehydratase FabZ [Gammaproteobacteria bacterium]